MNRISVTGEDGRVPDLQDPEPDGRVRRLDMRTRVQRRQFIGDAAQSLARIVTDRLAGQPFVR